jgi:hypothetical protein
MNQHLLQIELSPAEYQAFPSLQETYFHNLPKYVIARCPLCSATYSAHVDTYSLRYWYEPCYGESISGECEEGMRCSHFVAIHHFVNLNGVMPTELHYKSLGCEVPYVIPVFLPDDIKSYAVMHALPICRVEDDQFVPRYSVYMITYYSKEPSTLMERRWKISSSECILIGVGLLKRSSWKLTRWVQSGKLQWLDPDVPGLPLRTGPVEAFPYVNIRGRKDDSNIYLDGKWVNPSFLASLKRYIRGEMETR